MNLLFKNQVSQSNSQTLPAPRTPARRWSRLVTLSLSLLVALLMTVIMVAITGGDHIAHAAVDDLYVIPGGLTSGTCQRTTNPSSPFDFQYTAACDLTYALQVAVDGDTLRLQGDDDDDGEAYALSIVITKSLTLQGGYPPGFGTGTTEPVANPATQVTIIRPTTAVPAITIEGPITTTATTNVFLNGLQIAHLPGAANSDRGILINRRTGSSLTGLKVNLSLTQSKLSGNVVSGNGGGIYVESQIIANITATNSDFTSNKATSGGAVYLPTGSIFSGTTVTFTTNEASAGGGAIYASTGTTVTLTSASMSGNKATGGNGGAIFSQGKTVTVSGSIINSEAAGLGGGLYLSGTTTLAATLSPLALTGNKATNGGAIYALGTTLNLTGGPLTSNQATAGSGGALYQSGGTATIDAMNITGNTASMHGGGIYRANGALSLKSNTNVMSNIATTGSGGGIAIVSSEPVTLTGVVFLNNTAGTAGGGAYLAANSATVSGSTFYTNTAPMGGGVYLSGTVSGSISGNTIQFNKASTGNGGGLYFNNATLTVGGLNLSRNASQAGSGGGLYANNSKLTSSGPVTFTLNTAQVSGGGAYLAANSAMTATASAFTLNTAQISGGALYADLSRFVSSGATTVMSNTATSENGGAFFFDASTANLGTATLVGNKANISGGALYAKGNSALTGTSLTAQYNTVTTGNGGAIYLENSTLAWSGANTVKFNKADDHGGALYFSGGRMTVGGGATIISNTVTTGNGGAVYVTANGGYTVTGLLDMQENIAKIDGGAIFVDTGRLALIGGGTIKKNVASTGKGGAITFANSSTATFGAFTLESNRAQTDGGVLAAQASTFTFTGDTTVISNTATTGNGGAFHLTVSSSLTFALKGTLKGNIAALNGGAIYAVDSNLAFGNDSLIADNIAQGNPSGGAGGGVYLANGGLTTAKISFLRNKAKTDGGGLFAPGGALTLANGSLVQLNQAQTGNGGGIYAGGGAATLTGVTVEQNTAQVNGGGLYLTGAATALLVQSNSIVRQNTSNTAQGGGFYVTGGSVTINGSQVSNNQAQRGGGGLYQTTGTLVITNSATIDANKTITGSGGGLAIITGTVNIVGSNVNLNSAFGDGGGLYAPGGQVAIRNTGFSGNFITFDTSIIFIDETSLPIARGGGVYVDGTNIIVDGSTFSDNSAKMGGGGLYANTLFAHVADSEMTGNDGGRGAGGAAFIDADFAEVLANTLTFNETAGNGGGLAIADTTASNVISNTLADNFVRQDVVVTTTVVASPIKNGNGAILVPAGTVVTSQDTTEGSGGGLHLIRSASMMVGNTFLRNESKSGDAGAIYFSNGTVSMTNNIVIKNSIAMAAAYASGIFVNSTKLTMIHNTVADNTNKSANGVFNVGVYVTKSGDESSAVQLTNNIVSGHQSGIVLLTSNTAGLTNNLFFNTDENWGGPVEYNPASGNKVGDPLFVNTDADDYSIQRKSAAFDMGIATSVTTDILGTKRPRAFGVDAGAYEHRYLQGVHMRATATPQFVGSGEQISYQIQVVNHSPVPLTVNVNVTLPSQQTVSNISGPGCGGTACNLGTMAPEQQATITLVTIASGTPPDSGFIEMATTVNVSVNTAGPSDTTETLTTRLQRCRIRYANSDYGNFAAAIAAVNIADDLPDIIRVSGYCGGNVDINKKLTLQGGWNFPMTVYNPTTFPTTIDGGGSGRVLNITGDIAPTVENITLRNGNAGGKGGGPSGKDAGGIVYISGARATLNNVRMIGGRAAMGAGLFIAPLTAPIIQNSTIENGQASERGGGVYANNSSPELTNVTIKNNTASAGGGIYLYKGEAKIIGCNISDNRATGAGSYLAVAGFNVRFSVGGGGGVNFDESKGTISGSTLERNTAKAGGAIFADNSPASVSSSLINNNEANGGSTVIPIIVLANKPGGGGAIYAQRSDLVLEHNRITNNRATSAAGGAIHIFNGTADAKINGNFLGYNSAGTGSAVYVHLKPDTFKIFVLPLSLPDFLLPIILGQPQPDPPKLTMQNNTIAHNSGGSAVYFYGESYGELVGNIFAFNSGTGVVAESEILPYLAMIPVPIIMFIPIPFAIPYMSKVTADYTLWYNNGGTTSGSLGSSVSNNNSMTGDPAFKNDGYHIKRISIAYNAGKNIGIPVDIDGMTRPQADLTDMGADEYPGIGVRYVAPGGADNALCNNFLAPCGSLQAAIDAAREGDLIKMAGGTYTVKATRNEQTQIGYITKTLTIQGGYYKTTAENSILEGNYTANDWEVPYPDLNPTILDAGNTGRALFILDEKRMDDEGNPIKVEPTISGVSIKNGNSNGQKGPQGNQFDAGGAIYLDKTTATIVNVDISNSTADYGGAVYMISSTLTLDDVIVKNNTANARGGGFYLETSNDVNIANIIIEGNKAPRGGGLYFDRSAAMLISNQIRTNGDSAATLEGGGIYLDNSPATIISNTITANNARNGAGLFTNASDATIIGNIITNNKALNSDEGNGRGGGCFLGPGNPTLENNLLQGNQAIYGAGCYLNESGAILLTNQILENIATLSGGGLYFRNSSESQAQSNLINLNRANGIDVDNGGGGIFMESSNAAIRENTISNNIANTGGAIYLFSFSNALVQKNIVTNNTATVDGGGLYLKLSDASVSENIITLNKTSQGNGGGVYIRLSNAQLRENTIEENTAVLGGGGVYLDQSGAVLTMDSVRNNIAKDGAGIYVFRSDTTKFVQVGIELNRASQFGGGLYIRLSAVPVEDQVIANNFAQVAGGGVYIDESAVKFNRNTIRNNEAGQQGGGIAITRRSLPIMGSNAIVDNRAGNTGSGIYVAGSRPQLIHTTIARNVGGDGTGIVAITLDGSPSTVTLVNTILASQSLAVRASTGNTITLQATLWDGNAQKQQGPGVVLLGAAELNFDGPASFKGDGIHIQINSRAIGAGVTTEVNRDIDGDGRPQGGGPELGADELLAECAAVVYRSPNVLPNVYIKVQDAIDVANPGDEVRVAGTCTGAVLRAGTTQLAYINEAITVRGGYTPTNWLLSSPITQPTFLDAQGQGRVFFIAPNTAATIEYLNLSNGDATNQAGGPSGLDAGGNIYVRNANPILRELTMIGGKAYYGGALYLENSSLTFSNSNLDGNTGTKGGAIFLRNSPVTLRNNTVNNNASNDGAGIFLSFSHATLENNIVSLNKAASAGGGIFSESSNATMRNNSVITNTAQIAGGVYVDGAGPSILRNSISGNTGQNAGGIYLTSSNATVNGNQFIANSGGIGAGVYIQAGNPTFDNNVVAKNTGQIQAAALYILSSSPKLRHNTFAANLGGDGSGLFITDLGVQPANIEMVNNIIVDHTQAISLTAGNKVTMRSNLFNNNAVNWGGAGIVDDKLGHVVADPLFVNGDEGDYHLQPASPARDKGVNNAGVAVDYDNQGRPADNGFDMGADEFVFTGIQVFIQTVPDPVVAGAPFQLVVRVINIGNIDQNARITVTLPSAMTPSGVLTFDALIRRSETWIQTIDATVNASFSGALKVNADVTTSANANESIEASISVAKPDFAIAIIAEASPNPVPAGAELVYQIRVNNVGNLPINPTIEAELPAAVTVAAPMNFAPGALGPGGAWTKSVVTTVAPDAEGNLTAVFRATTAEGPTASYTLVVPVAAPSLDTSISARPEPVFAGQSVTYTLRVTNTGNVDFNTTITFVAPVNENGRPLIAPGADQVFQNVALVAGQTWTENIVALTQPGYVGPLNTKMLVDTHTGSAALANVAEAMDTPDASIALTETAGAEPDIPLDVQADIEAIIVENDTLQVILPTRGPTIIAVRTGAWDDPNTWEPKRVPNESDIALVNEDVVVTVQNGDPNPIVMKGLINPGTILLNCVLGVDMELSILDFIENPGLIRGRDGQAIGEPGCGITVITNELINPGTIRGGDGMDGAVIPPNNDIINGGEGGAMTVFAQSVVNGGLIRAGDGGDLLFPATSGKGGDGGDILVAAGPPFPALILNTGVIEAGNGGKGPGRPQGNGRGGDGGSASVISASQYINDGGAVNAGLGGDGGDDDGNNGAASISAAFIWDNGVMSANGRDFGFNTQARRIVRGVPGATVLIPIFFINEGQRTDTYILIWANSAGWVQEFLPETRRVNGLRYDILRAPFTIPTGMPRGTVNQVLLTARSQGQPALVQEETILVQVVAGGSIWMPKINRSDPPTASADQAAPIEPSQPAQELYFFPLIGDAD